MRATLFCSIVGLCLNLYASDLRIEDEPTAREDSAVQIARSGDPRIIDLENRLRAWSEKRDVKDLLEKIVADAERWFTPIATTPQGGMKIGRTEDYEKLSADEKLRLHSVLQRAYFALGRVAEAEAHALALESLGEGTKKVSTADIVRYCAQGRYAEAMYLIEQIDKAYPADLKLIITPEDASFATVRSKLRELGTKRDDVSKRLQGEQLQLRRCLAQIYIAEDNRDLAIAQFQLMQALNPRYRVSEDSTLPATRKVVEVFEAARPKSNPTVALLAALGGVGVLVGSQSGGAVTGGTASVAIVLEPLTSDAQTAAKKQSFRVRLVHRDPLGNVVRPSAGSSINGTIRIDSVGANYTLTLQEEDGGGLMLSDKIDGQIAIVRAKYTATEGQASFIVHIDIPSSGDDGLDITLPDVTVQFPITVEVLNPDKIVKGPVKSQSNILIQHSSRASRQPAQQTRWDDAIRIECRQGNRHAVIFLPLKGLMPSMLSSRESEGLRCTLLPAHASVYRFSVESNNAAPVTLTWELPDTARRRAILLTDLSAQRKVSLGGTSQYVFTLGAGERRVFEIAIEPRVNSGVLITSLQSVASRSSGGVSVAATLNQQAELRISVQDMRGCVLYTTSRVGTRGVNNFTLIAPELRAAPPGAYLITVEAQNEGGSVARRSAPLILTR